MGRRSGWSPVKGARHKNGPHRKVSPSRAATSNEEPAISNVEFSNCRRLNVHRLAPVMFKAITISAWNGSEQSEQTVGGSMCIGSPS